MKMLFTRIPYAVTLPDGEIVDTGYAGNAGLVCEFCGVRVSLSTNAEGVKSYEHWLINNVAVCRASTCKYRHFSTGDWQPYHALQPLGHALCVPAWTRKRIPQATITRKWRCVLCRHRYYGNKQCQNCGDWTCTLPAH